jgi:hypothetical protein
MTHMQAHLQVHNLEAFCTACPTPQEVTSVLQEIGFSLVFRMEAVSSVCADVPPLPAQYHYRKGNCEVIFLAGHDVDLDGIELPEHASRFWLHAGADAARFVAQVLAIRWPLTWRRLPESRQEVA